MKKPIAFAALCISLVCCQKQTEVITKTSGYVVDEKIISDVTGKREEHRSKITNHNGEVTEHVVIKLFSMRMMVSYGSEESTCFVAPLEIGDTPVPSAVFEDVTDAKPVRASKGRVVEEGVVEFSPVDSGASHLPPEVLAECGGRTPQVVRPTTFTNVHGGRVKRGWSSSGPGACGSRLSYQKKCTSTTTSRCCKQCKTTVPFCYKDYYYEDKPCDPPSNGGYGGGSGGYGNGNGDNGHNGGYGGSHNGNGHNGHNGGHGGSHNGNGDNGHNGGYGGSHNGNGDNGHNGGYGGSHNGNGDNGHKGAVYKK